MNITDDFIYELKSRCDIESTVSSYLQLKRRGRVLVGLCPFHLEKTPSFTIYPDDQHYYCFGCGAGGDVITFIRQIENLDYPEAVSFLAERANMPLPADTGSEENSRKKRRILEMNREAAIFFYRTLCSKEGGQAREYLRKRGISQATIKKFGLGYAPESWDSLLKHLVGKGFSTEEMRAAYLVSKGKNGYYDIFRGRIIFPIFGLRGNIIAFGGRVLDDSVPKYLNSSDTPVFNKKRNLFSLNFAKNSKEKRIILCEGYMDVISLHQEGVTNAVASLGTALTPEQARLLARYANEVVISYDSDQAGQAATQKAIDLFKQMGLQVKVLKLGDAKDPDEYIKKHGVTRFMNLLDKSDNAIKYQLEKIKSESDITTPEGKVEYLKKAARIMAKLDNIECEVYASEIAQALSVSKDTILQTIRSIQKKEKAETNKKAIASIQQTIIGKGDKINPEKRQNLRAARAEEGIIAVLFRNPDYFSIISSRITEDEYITQFNRRVFARICDSIRNQRNIDLSIFSEDFTPEEIGRIVGIVSKTPVTGEAKKILDEFAEALLRERNKPGMNEIIDMEDSQLNEYLADLARLKIKKKE